MWTVTHATQSLRPLSWPVFHWPIHWTGMLPPAPHHKSLSSSRSICTTARHKLRIFPRTTLKDPSIAIFPSTFLGYASNWWSLLIAQICDFAWSDPCQNPCLPKMRQGRKPDLLPTATTSYHHNLFVLPDLFIQLWSQVAPAFTFVLPMFFRTWTITDRTPMHSSQPNQTYRSFLGW